MVLVTMPAASLDDIDHFAASLNTYNMQATSLGDTIYMPCGNKTKEKHHPVYLNNFLSINSH